MVKKSIVIQTDKVEDNVLHQYASYNYLFTLSALTQQEHKASQFIYQGPSNIIARSAGIGADEDQSIIDDEGGLDAEVAKTLNKRGIETLANSRKILEQNRDLYFNSVEINSIHGMNSARGTGTNTNIRIQLTEPTGTTLISKLQAAAANSGFREYTEAPFLLTLEFRGFDDKGKQLPPDKGTTTRHIPIKIIKMDINVNQAGAVYDLQAVPDNEFGYMDRLNVTRTVMNMSRKNDRLKDWALSLQTNLNRMTEEEAEQNFATAGKETKYRLLCHPDLAELPVKPSDGFNNTKNVPMSDTTVDAPLHDFEAVNFDKKDGQIRSNTNIAKTIEDYMKSLPKYKDVVNNWFERQVTAAADGSLEDKILKGSTVKEFLQNQKTNDFYVDWFRVRTSVMIDDKVFDEKTKQHQKTVVYYIYPCKVHVFNLSVPGLSQFNASQFSVKKIYDYIFTGNNTDVLNLDISYKVAYYNSMLKSADPKFKSNTLLKNREVEGFGQGALDSVEPDLPLKANVSLAGSKATGATTDVEPSVDVFMDKLTHPEADMIQLDLEILGDPAWIPTTQWLQVSPPAVDPNAGPTNSVVGIDQNEKWLGVGDTIGFNDTTKSYNTTITDPVIGVQFKLPSDFNEAKGTYNISTESGLFSGLYQIFQTISKFENGTFTQNLIGVRFKNQSDGTDTSLEKTNFVLGVDGKITTPELRERARVNSEARQVTRDAERQNEGLAGNTF